MKKIIRLLVLLLVFIPFVKVDAGVRVRVTPSTDIKNDIYWLGDYGTIGSVAQFTGKMQGGKGIYHYPTRKYTGSLGGHTFDMVCIDPGVMEGSTYYNCEELNDPDILELFKNKGSYSDIVFMTAVRMKAAKARHVGSKTYGPYTSSDKRNSMKYYGSSGASIFGKGNTYSHRGADPGTVSIGGSSAITQADSIANTISSSAAGASPAGPASFSAVYVDNLDTTVIINITSTVALKMTPKITCTSGCNGEPSVTWAAGSNTGQVRVRLQTGTGAPCNPVFKIEYVPMGGDATNNLYICYAGGGTGGGSTSREQKFITMISNTIVSDASGGAGGIGGGDATDGSTPGKQVATGITVTIPNSFRDAYCSPGPTCCSISVETQVDIKFCCEVGTTSTVKEPKIKDIFCVKKNGCGTNENIKVEGAYDLQAGNYDEPYVINDYCRIYCTERIKVEIPGKIEGVNGKYFDLNGTSSIAGPQISGNYSCRNVIDYDRWVKEYYNQTNNAVNAYNQYQYDRARSDAYKQAFDDASHDGTTTYTVNYKYEKTLYTDSDAQGNKKSCTGKTEASCTVTMEYKYNLETPVTVNYGQAKLTYNGTQTGSNLPVSHFERFDVKKDSDKSFSTITGFYGLRYKHPSNDYKCDSSPSSSGHVSCTATGWCKTKNTDGSCKETEGKNLSADDAPRYFINEDGKPDDKQGEIDNDNPSLGTINGHVGNFTTAVNNLSNLKENIEKCDKYFDATLGDYAAFLNDKFQVPTVKFEWFYTYLNVKNYVDVKSELIEYNQTGSHCSPTGTGEYHGGEDPTTGVQNPHYDSLNSVYDGTFTTFNKANIACNNSNSRYCGSRQDLVSLINTHNEQQKYTSDTMFTYECEYTPPTAADKFTVYPYGGYNEALDLNKHAYTKYEGKLYVEYSTLEGTYQTNWYFNGLGSKISPGVGKFDEYFKNGEDCTGVHNNSIDQSMLFCDFKVSKSLTKIRGCHSIASLFSGSTNWAKVCCDDPSCYSIIDDTLSYSFKIVDSSKLFPGTTGYSESSAPTGTNSDGHSDIYAYNWFKTDKGRTNLQNIETSSGYEKEYNKDRITYQFHLNSKAINTLKEYNAHINNYNSLVGGDYTAGKNETGPATKYHSKLIEDFYNSQLQLYRVSGSTVTTTGSPVHLNNKNYGGSTALNNARAKVHWDGV